MTYNIDFDSLCCQAGVCVCMRELSECAGRVGLGEGNEAPEVGKQLMGPPPVPLSALQKLVC